jgi:UDP-glucose 4-epimerase
VEIADIIIQEMNLKNVKKTFTGSERGWPGDQPQVFLSVNKVKKLGWYPTHTSTEAVRIATRRMLGLEKFVYGKK